MKWKLSFNSLVVMAGLSGNLFAGWKVGPDYQRPTTPTEAQFADAELLGCPLRITLGARSLESGELELQIRRGQENKSIPLEGAAEAVQAELAAID